jgi:hypothetical protein
MGMSIGAKRVMAAVLGLAAVITGAWAAAAPRSFFTSFPLPGHHWVSALPPYNEHLTLDGLSTGDAVGNVVGLGATLLLAVLLLVPGRRTRRDLA